jgi:hypothetical protein
MALMEFLSLKMVVVIELSSCKAVWTAREEGHASAT